MDEALQECLCFRYERRLILKRMAKQNGNEESFPFLFQKDASFS